MFRIHWTKLFAGLVVAFSSNGYSQEDADSLNDTRLKPLIISSAVVYSGSLVALNELWYSDFDRQPFQFFNDNKEWNQMDKAGHMFAAFQISHSANQLLKWSGVGDKKALLWSVLTSAALLTPIEIFDGFSAAYGASLGDIAANTAGAGLYYFQKTQWGDIRIHPKFYFKRSNYPELRPELLGKSLHEELVKDYNAQEYWLSVDLSKFNSGIPKWLNFAFGYGASGMISANKTQNEEQGFNPSRHYFIGLDLDLNEYKSRSKALNTLIFMINMIRIPAPALELNENKLKFHILY